MDDPATVRVRELDELEIALQRMGVGEGRPTLVLIGGASGLSEAEAARLTPLCVSLARMAERIRATPSEWWMWPFLTPARE